MLWVKKGKKRGRFGALVSENQIFNTKSCKSHDVPPHLKPVQYPQRIPQEPLQAQALKASQHCCTNPEHTVLDQHPLLCDSMKPMLTFGSNTFPSSSLLPLQLYLPQLPLCISTLKPQTATTATTGCNFFLSPDHLTLAFGSVCT